MPAPPVVLWFRSDLRLADHPALAAAAATGAPVVALYVLDDETPGQWKLGGATRWWLHGSLEALAAGLKRLGVSLVLRRGRADRVIQEIVEATKASAVYCSRAYEPWARALEDRLHKTLAARSVPLKRYPGTLLIEPESVTTKTGGPYRVYTPFWRAISALEIRSPVAAPRRLTGPDPAPKSDRLADWKLLPTKPDWAGGLREAWTPGEKAADARLETFLEEAIEQYADDRNRPDRPATSRLSPHLRHGEVSPALCWHRARAAAASGAIKDGVGLETFLKELAWREFSYHLLFHYPDLAEVPFRPEFAAFPWAPADGHLAAWQKGRTGYPIVDAGMRELWTTGWMHNRVRMIVGSFLVKHLLIPWQDGEAWFWDTLVDADPASNAASWQWIAGSGADAAPYFRIFNPVKQGETYDPDGAYVRRWVPEIARLSDRALHAPWTASPVELKAAGIELGKTYPHPLVDHAKARARALAAYARLKIEDGAREVAPTTS